VSAGGNHHYFDALSKTLASLLTDALCSFGSHQLLSSTLARWGSIITDSVVFPSGRCDSTDSQALASVEAAGSGMTSHLQLRNSHFELIKLSEPL
jgi:hypothetical protein